MLNTNITDLCQRASDEELAMIRAIASQHINWRRDHRAELKRCESNCRCGATLSASNPLRDRGYMVGIECDSCR
jgi:hypothetical protein